MPTKTFYSKLFLLAIALTLFAIAIKDFLPQRRLSLIPIGVKSPNFFLLPGNDPTKADQVKWIDQAHFKFRCDYTNSDQVTPCNLIYMLGPDGIQGMDLRKYHSLNLYIHYRGNAKYLRFSIRNYDPRFSNKEDPNSAKFNFINIRTRDLNAPLTIDLSELTVAEWWLNQFPLPREQAKPDFSNATNISIDFIESLSNTDNEIQVEKIEFVGNWISNEHWYLSILLAWMAVGTVYGIQRLRYLQKIEAQQKSRISDLVVSNANLRIETDKLQKLSTTDTLTKAFNRHGIENILAAGETKHEQVAIILFDIDHFKRINDRRGHDAGDRVLQAIGEMVLTRIRTSDRFGRWGGEEFILICPHTSVGMALALAEKLRICIFDYRFEPEAPLTVTASFGVTALRPGENFSSAIKRADEALYEAKSMGRNCVMVSSGDWPPKDLI